MECHVACPAPLEGSYAEPMAPPEATLHKSCSKPLQANKVIEDEANPLTAPNIEPLFLDDYYLNTQYGRSVLEEPYIHQLSASSPGVVSGPAISTYDVYSSSG